MSVKKASKIVFVLLSIFVFPAWLTLPENPIKKAEWLIGTWENKTERGIIYETWSKVNDREFSGKSYMLNDKDTVVFETIRLVQEEDAVLYIPTVANQNEGLPVHFAVTTISDTELVFENPQHDYPKNIFYIKINRDSLVAGISGAENGKEQKQLFPMRRVK